MRLLAINKIVESALMVGETPLRIIAKIYSDKVWAEGPAQKNETKKSSSEIINTNNPAATKAGMRIGTTIRKNVWFNEAPKSYDASIIL